MDAEEPGHMHRDDRYVLSNRRIKSADRQADFRKRMIAQGMVQVSGWTHTNQSSDVVELMRRLRGNRDLTVGPVRNTVTGKLEKLEK